MKQAALAFLCCMYLFVVCAIRAQNQELSELLDSAGAAQTAGDYGHAVTLYRRATSLSPGTAELWSNLGVMEFLAQAWDPAATDLRHALKLKPDLFVSLLFLGKVYVQQKEPATALPFLLRAQAQQPHDVEVLRSLGKAYEGLHREGDAVISYHRATELAPQDVNAWLGLGSASLELITVGGRTLATSAPHSPWAQALYADELLAQDRPIEATDTYKSVLAAATPTDKAMLAHMLAYMQNNPSQFPLPVRSQTALQQLVKAAEGAVPVTKESDDAASTFCAATNRRYSPPVSIRDPACAFWAKNYWLSASDAQQILQKDLGNTEALYWSIKANEHIAVDALSRVDDLAPNSAINHDLVGDLYRYQRQVANAIAEYDKALALDAHDPSALLGETTTYLSVSRYGEATAMVRRALSDHPLDPQANLLMAEILGAQGHEDQAAQYLSNCMNIGPEFQPRVHYLLGRTAIKAGNLQEAIRQLEQALAGDEDGSTHYQLSRLYRQTGNRAKAQMTENEAKRLIAQHEVHAAIALREEMATAP